MLLVVELERTILLECLTNEELVGEYANIPDIGPVILYFSSEYFLRVEVRCVVSGFKIVIRALITPSKV